MLPSADPTANPEPTEPSGELPGTWDQLDGFELGMLLSWNNRAHGSNSSSGRKYQNTLGGISMCFLAVLHCSQGTGSQGLQLLPETDTCPLS